MYSISDIDELYKNTAHGKFALLNVYSTVLESYHGSITKVRQKLLSKEISDPEIQNIIRYLYYIHNEFATCPLNYTNAFFRRNDRKNALNSMVRTVRPSYPDLSLLIDEALENLIKLISSDESPLLETIERHVGFRDLTIYVIHGMYAEPIKTYLALYGIEANVQPAGLNKFSPTLNSVYCGRLSDYCPGFFYARPHSNTFLARMSHLWDQPARLPEISGSIPSSVHLSYEIIEDQRRIQVANPDPFDQMIDLQGLNIVERLNSTSRSKEGGLENIDARALILKNNNYVLLPADPEYTHHFIYDIASNPKAGKRKLAKVDSQTAILLKQKDKTDYILSMADKFLGIKAKQLRAQQADWKARLRRIVNAYGLNEVSHTLRAHGCLSASPQNLRNWLNPRFIRPDSTPHFIKVLEYAGYESGQIEIARSMKEIFTAHVLAGNWISQKLKMLAAADLSITDILAQGTKTYVLDGIDDISLEAHLCEGLVEGVIKAHHSELGIVKSMEELYG